MPKKFALIGAAGYVAPKHMDAIKRTRNTLVAALDPSDSVGIIDNYFPDAQFFTDFERFDRHFHKIRRMGDGVDFVSICSPNHLHDAHCRFSMRSGANVICEKPLVLNPWNLEALQEIEKETGKEINNILQLRLHPSIISLKESVSKTPPDRNFEIDLTYITSRGAWYATSWKGQEGQSGGIATNIGVHFFDMLIWIFGTVRQSIVNVHTHDVASGILYLNRARIRWILSTNRNLLPKSIRIGGLTTHRSMKIGEDQIEFSKGFDDLHVASYRSILNGQGYSTEDTKSAIQLVHDIRNAPVAGLKGDYHPLLSKIRGD